MLLTWPRAVRSLTTRALAMSSFEKPRATSFSTSSSRSVRGSGVGGKVVGWLSSRMSRRAMLGCSDASPRLTSRMARISSSGDESFSR